MSVETIAQGAYRAPGQDNFQDRPRACFGFTLIELLVVIAVVAILAALLFPVFAAAQDSGRRARCALQLKQLVEASIAYADDYDGRYVPAAKDIYSTNRQRWHGYRDKSKTDFDSRKGPLWNYIARCGGLKKCPSAQNLQDLTTQTGAFESGCGGFGYNAAYVGGTYYKNIPVVAQEIASLASDIADPPRTIMFADAAMAKNFPTAHMIEYSFVEPPFIVTADGPGDEVTSPSMHFRHNGRINVGWCDGHVSSQKMTFTRPGLNAYRRDNEGASLGWFGPDDNSLFDNR